MLKLPESRFSSPSLSPAQADKFSAHSAALDAAGDAAAPPILRDTFDEIASDVVPKPQLTTVPIKEPEEGEECPICYEEFKGENIAYCAFGCGRAVHADCYERYERAVEGEPRCVLCRVPWRQSQGGKQIGRGGVKLGRRYVNLAEHIPGMFEQKDRGGRAGDKDEDEERDWEPDEEESNQKDEDESWEPAKASKAKGRKRGTREESSSTDRGRGKRRKVKGEKDGLGKNDENGKKEKRGKKAEKRKGKKAQSSAGGVANEKEKV